jgi:hypothetical protein
MDAVETFTGPAAAGDTPPPPLSPAFEVVPFEHAVRIRSVATDAIPTHLARALDVVCIVFPFPYRMHVVGAVCVVYGQAPSMDGGKQGR